MKSNENDMKPRKNLIKSCENQIKPHKTMPNVGGSRHFWPNVKIRPNVNRQKIWSLGFHMISFGFHEIFI